MKYSIDTSAILECWVRRYPPEIFPAVWVKLDELIDKKILIATEEVLYELERKHDDVFKWAKHRENMFVPHNMDIQLYVKNILNHPQHKYLTKHIKNRTSADPFVIALAQLERCTVITAEIPTNNPEKPRIPDVCKNLNIEWITILDLFKEQKWVFR